MDITPEQARWRLKVIAVATRILARREKHDSAARVLREAAEDIDWALARIAELETQLADMRRDLSDARSGWESAVAEVRELED